VWHIGFCASTLLLKSSQAIRSLFIVAAPFSEGTRMRRDVAKEANVRTNEQKYPTNGVKTAMGVEQELPN
jgi:hypothetical protein